MSVAIPGVYWALACIIALLVGAGLVKVIRRSRRALEALRAGHDQLQARFDGQQAELAHTRQQLEEQRQLVARQNAELAAAREQLDRKGTELAHANQHRSELLADMSNELRTPLNSALILSKMLADNRMGNLTPEQVKFATSIYSAGSDLLEMTHDMLDLSSLEAGTLELHDEPIEIGPFVAELARTFKPLAEQKRIGFSVEQAPNLPTAMETDLHRLQQILRHLLSNALKFTERGNVSLHVTPDGENVVFTVRARRVGDGGLGLSISRELAHLLGGRIELQSVADDAGTLRLTVPKSRNLYTSGRVLERDGKHSRISAG